MSDPPALGSVAADAVYGMAPLLAEDERHDYAGTKLVAAPANLIQEVDDLARDQDDGTPGWGHVVDLDRAPLSALDWLAQMAGVDTRLLVQQPGETEVSFADRKRAMARDVAARKRGTPAAMKGAALPTLTGAKILFFYERHQTHAYRLLVMSYASQTPDPGLTEQTLRSQKPAGIVLTYLVITGQTYQQLRDNHTDYTAVDTEYNNYDAARRDEPDA